MKIKKIYILVPILILLFCSWLPFVIKPNGKPTIKPYIRLYIIHEALLIYQDEYGVLPYYEGSSQKALFLIEPYIPDAIDLFRKGWHPPLRYCKKINRIDLLDYDYINLSGIDYHYLEYGSGNLRRMAPSTIIVEDRKTRNNMRKYLTFDRDVGWAPLFQGKSNIGNATRPDGSIVRN